MNSFLSSSTIKRPSASRCIMLMKSLCCRVELPQSNIQVPKGGKECECSSCRIRGKNKQRAICKKAVTRGLNQSLAPIFDFCLNRREVEAIFESERNEFIRTISLRPGHKKEICASESVQCELSSGRKIEYFPRCSQLAFEINHLETGKKPGLTIISRRSSRQIDSRIMATELDDLKFRECRHRKWASGERNDLRTSIQMFNALIYGERNLGCLGRALSQHLFRSLRKNNIKVSPAQKSVKLA